MQLQVKMPKFLLNTLQPSENPAADVPPFAPLRYKAEGSPHRSHKLLLGSAGGQDIELFPSRAARLGRAMAREEERKATATCKCSGDLQPQPEQGPGALGQCRVAAPRVPTPHRGLDELGMADYKRHVHAEVWCPLCQGEGGQGNPSGLGFGLTQQGSEISPA